MDWMKLFVSKCQYIKSRGLMSRVTAFFYLQSCMCTSSSANSLLKWRMNMLDWASLGESQARPTRLLMPPHNPTSLLTQSSSTQRQPVAGQHPRWHVCARALNAHSQARDHFSALLLLYYRANSSNLAVLIGGAYTFSLTVSIFVLLLFFFLPVH